MDILSQSTWSFLLKTLNPWLFHRGFKVAYKNKNSKVEDICENQD